MSQIHILRTSSHGGQIFNGMFGTIAKVSEEVVKLQIDESIRRCSSLTSGPLAAGLEVRADEITTIEADDAVITAIKAMLARGLQERWNRHYASMIPAAPATEYGLDRLDRAGAVLVAVPGMNSVTQSALVQALKAEREVANRGIDTFVESLQGVAPHFVTLHAPSAYVSHDEDGVQSLTTVYSNLNSKEDLNPQPISSWGDFTHPAYSAPAAEGEDTRSGYCSLDVAIPVYLPVQGNEPAIARQPEPVGAQAAAQTRTFSFASRGAAPATGPAADQAGEQSAAEATVSRDLASDAAEIIRLVMATPVLHELVVSSPAARVADFRSMSQEIDPADEDQEDEDEEDDGNEDQHRPRMN